MKKRIFWKKIKQRGPIIQNNADAIMRDEGYLYAYDEKGELTDEIVCWMPKTYNFTGVPAYNSYSALRPIGSKKNPKLFEYFDFDEDEGCASDASWRTQYVSNPLAWQTEIIFLERIGIR
ncbi:MULTISPECIES: hypothetical protein [Enterococcus]|uniref:hypothetical protein n=1 Tax=Enterococcus TaxID=1350 RepID=UPI000B5AA694|nr:MULTISPECIES: hypothetical protein [Enterococcus]OTO15127.1 hypothetical protein A5875_004284 [Enterococcus sp. 3H8_DIV0648]